MVNLESVLDGTGRIVLGVATKLNAPCSTGCKSLPSRPVVSALLARGSSSRVKGSRTSALLLVGLPAGRWTRTPTGDASLLPVLRGGGSGSLFSATLVEGGCISSFQDMESSHEASH